jgi:DNA replication protein
MKRYGGFPARMLFTAIPEPFFSHVLPQMSDMAELRAVLTVFRLLCRKRGSLRFVTAGELRGDAALMNGLAAEGKQADQELAAALAMAVERGIILPMSVGTADTTAEIYFLNTEADRQMVAKLLSGEVAIPGMKTMETAHPALSATPDVFTTYEENIGLLTPMIADELRDALKTYPTMWIQDAIREAANNNKRKWSYVSAILERWGSEGKSDGRSDGTNRGYPKKTDPDKYIKGRYGHMVQR